MQKLKKESAGFRDLDIFEMSKYGIWRAILNFFLTFFHLYYNIVGVYNWKVKKTPLQRFFSGLFRKEFRGFLCYHFIG